MPTSDEIFEGFKSILKYLNGSELGHKLGTDVLDSMHKHRENDKLIAQLKDNMKRQTQQFLSDLEGLENKKCPRAISGHHH
jgi:hypothetical protein